MKCHKCGTDPIGVCAFCGRAVCDDCKATMPFILTMYVGDEGVPKAVVVSNALWCRTCKPQPEPIPMPELS
jgi:hypothetical protein